MEASVAFWLDTGGNHHGAMIFRWLRAEDAPVPTVRLVPVTELDRVLPADTPRVDAAGRREILEARRAAVQRRFPR
jgi:hypothetical protein